MATAAADEQRIPLADAAMAIGCSWTDAWKLVLTRSLDGEKRRGRWYVTRLSVERVKAERASESAAVAV